jgi:hypothetical protein
METIRYAAHMPTSGWCFGETEEDALDLCDGEPLCDPIKLPTRKEVCPRCRGEGKHDHPAFSNGISQEEFEEDPDFADNYHAGVYDVQCTECNGLRVVDVIDEAELDPSVLEGLRAWRREMAELRAIEAAERRAGA